MPNVQYVGTADNRTITKTDWESMDVDDQDDVTWGQGGSNTVSEKALAALKDRMPDEFKTAEEVVAESEQQSTSEVMRKPKND